MNAQVPMPNYPRGSYDPFHSGYGCNDPHHARRRHPLPYPMSAAAGPSHQLPGISTLPPGSTLPQPLSHSSHTAGSLRSPATVMPLESSLAPVMRSRFAPMNVPEHHQSRAWQPPSTFADLSSYTGGREQSMHEFGNPPHLEDHQHIAHSGRFPTTEGPRQEIRNALNFNDRYSHPLSMPANHDHPQVYFSPDFRRNPSIPGANHARTATPTATLPPIVPGPYGDEGHIRSAPSPLLQQETALDGRTAQPHRQVNGTGGNQQQHTPSRCPEPQA